MSDTCLIWGTPAQIDSNGGDFLIVDSPRAGGKYRLSGSVSTEKVRNFREKAKLTEWLELQRRNGDAAPLITSYTFKDVLAIPNLGIVERRNRALEFLAKSSVRYGATIRVDRAFYDGSVDEALNTRINGLQLATLSENEDEARSFLSFLHESNFIHFEGTTIQITFSGWEHIERQRAAIVESAQAFVAMWFDASMEAAYRDGIAPAIQACGYRVVRIDKKEHVNKIDDEIVAEIRRSRFVIADFTSEADKPRGGVYFEAGFAWGLNKPVIWTCREDALAFVHFDTRQFNHIVWKDAAELRKKLENRIGAILGQGPLPVSEQAPQP